MTSLLIFINFYAKHYKYFRLEDTHDYIIPHHLLVCDNFGGIIEGISYYFRVWSINFAKGMVILDNSIHDLTWAYVGNTVQVKMLLLLLIIIINMARPKLANAVW